MEKTYADYAVGFDYQLTPRGVIQETGIIRITKSQPGWVSYEIVEGLDWKDGSPQPFGFTPNSYFGGQLSLVTKRLVKSVKVSDPENWYGKRTVSATLFVTEPYDGSRVVRMAIQSCDDKMLTFDITCNSDDVRGIEQAYIHIKTYLYDTLQKTISTKWLYRHGFLPF